VHVHTVAVGGRATECRHEKRIGSAGRGTSACVGIVEGAFATGSRHEKRIGSAGSGAGVNSN